MRKKMLLTAAFISALLFSAVAGTQLLRLSSANFFPEQTPSGIQITSYGAVEGTDLIQRSGNVYTFTGDIHRTIVVLCDEIVLDGAGYTLQGSGIGSGVFLQERNGVTIKNLKIMNFQYGIKFTWLNYGNSDTSKRSNTVSGNTLTNNTYGIMLMDSSKGNVFSDNKIIDNTYGLSFSNLVRSSNNVFRNNKFDGNDYSVVDNSGSPNDIDTSNVVNGKPVYYWFNQHDKTVPSDAGFVVLKNCSGITVQNLTLASNGHGVLLYYTTNSKIAGNVLRNNAGGIALRESSNNEISNNTITGSRDYGIYLHMRSKNNIIIENTIESTGKDGVHLEAGCPNNTITYNQIANSQEIGIYLSTSPNSAVIENNLVQNKLCGICLKYDTNGNTIRGNNLTKNGLGLLVETVGSIITGNTMINNDGWAIRLNGSQGNNVIHHNNFVDNNVGEGLQVSMPAVWSFYALGPDDFGNNSILNLPPSVKDSTLKDPTFGAANPNVWDDGVEGNYWSDYASRYPNASEVGITGVGDTPYFINENNIDHHPLIAPYETSTSDSPASSPSHEPESETEPFPTTLVVASVAIVGVFGFGFLINLTRQKRV